MLHEVSLDESIRYSVGDELEQWLNGLLCLDVTNVPRISSGCPLPQDCDLYPLYIKSRVRIGRLGLVTSRASKLTYRPGKLKAVDTIGNYSK